MKNLIFGSSWKTSVAGLIGSGILLLMDYLAPGDVDLKSIVNDLILYIIARLAGDSVPAEKK